MTLTENYIKYLNFIYGFYQVSNTAFMCNRQHTHTHYMNVYECFKTNIAPDLSFSSCCFVIVVLSSSECDLKHRTVWVLYKLYSYIISLEYSL